MEPDCRVAPGESPRCPCTLPVLLAIRFIQLGNLLLLLHHVQGSPSLHPRMRVERERQRKRDRERERERERESPIHSSGCALCTFLKDKFIASGSSKRTTYEVGTCMEIIRNEACLLLVARMPCTGKEEETTQLSRYHLMNKQNRCPTASKLGRPTSQEGRLPRLHHSLLQLPQQVASLVLQPLAR